MNEYTRILTSGQLATIKADVSSWHKKRIDKTVIKEAIEPYDFELVKDGSCWLRTGTLFLCWTNSATNHKGDAMEIEVLIGKPLEEICKKIATNLCRFLRAHLNGISGSNYPFNEVFKYKYKIWKAKAQEWLKDDLHQENDWAGCFKWLPWHGNKVRVELKTNKNIYHGDLIHYVDLLFDGNGCCKVEDRRNTFTRWMQNVVGGQGGLLGEAQLGRIDPYLAEAMVKTIRDKNYAHPYKTETVEKVIELKPALELVAAKFQISKLAFSGAYADLLERDSSIEVQKLHDIATEKFGKDIESFFKKIPFEIEELTSALLDLGAQHAGITFFIGAFGVTVAPEVAAGASMAYALWQLLPSDSRNEMRNRAFEFGHFFATLPRRLRDSVQAESKDEMDRKITEATLKQLPSNPEKGQPIKWSKLVSDAVDDMEQPHKNLFMIYYMMGKCPDLVKAAGRIESTLGDLSKPHRERKVVYKVERFFEHFQA